MAGGMAVGAALLRAEAVVEQVQLQLEGQLQTGDRGQNTLHALVDLDQVIHVGGAQVGGLLDLLVLGLQDASQGLLLLGDGSDQIGDGFAAAVIMTGRRGLDGFRRRIVLSLG